MSDQLRYNDFISRFKSRAQEFEEALSPTTGNPPNTKALEQLSVGIAELRSTVTEAVVAGVLPAYDQRLCEERVTQLEGSLSKIRSTSKPKSKFSFKSSINTRPTAQATSNPTSSIERSADSGATSNNTTTGGLSAAVPTTNITIKDHNHRVLTFADAIGLQSSVTSSAQSVVITIGGLSRCFVDLTSAVPFTVNALHVQGLKQTVLHAGKVRGSVLLHDCHESTIIVSAHQFRMHTSSTTNVYLEVSSNPVIEKCAGIRFGPFLPTGASGSVTESSSCPEKTDGGLPYVVQDFDWMGAGQSSNWASMGPALFQPPIGVSDDSLDSFLDNILPQVAVE